MNFVLVGAVKNTSTAVDKKHRGGPVIELDELRLLVPAYEADIQSIEVSLWLTFYGKGHSRLWS